MNNHIVTWPKPRPDFVIRFLRGTSRNCYHESFYEIVSSVPLDANDLARLDACDLLGMGQGYSLESTETLTETVQPVTIDTNTGQPALDADGNAIPPLAWNRQPFTATHDYLYQRYVVKRICDSGD